MSEMHLTWQLRSWCRVSPVFPCGCGWSCVTPAASDDTCDRLRVLFLDALLESCSSVHLKSGIPGIVTNISKTIISCWGQRSCHLKLGGFPEPYDNLCLFIIKCSFLIYINNVTHMYIHVMTDKKIIWNKYTINPCLFYRAEFSRRKLMALLLIHL